MTEYEPYGARHFLRAADAEGNSELRRHEIPLRDGTEVAKGGSRLVGDVDFDQVQPIAGKITPNPGGVGPMTIAMLMQNTVRAAELAAH